MLDPFAVNRVPVRVGVHDADGNNSRMRCIGVAERDRDYSHVAPLNGAEFLKTLSRQRTDVAYRVEGINPQLPLNTTAFEAQTRGLARIAYDEQHARLEAKLKRELGETVLEFLADERTEDIVLNPDSSLWLKQMGSGFREIGVMSSAQAASALNTIAPWKGTVMNHERPILETELPLDG